MSERKGKSSLAERISKGRMTPEEINRAIAENQRLQEERSASIEDTFDYHKFGDEPGRMLELEKAVRSAAYLLDYCSTAGNDRLNGCLAPGVAHTRSITARRLLS
jgi:hypothetical protein